MTNITDIILLVILLYIPSSIYLQSNLFRLSFVCNSPTDPSNPSSQTRSPFPNHHQGKGTWTNAAAKALNYLEKFIKDWAFLNSQEIAETIIQETPEEGVEPAEPAQVPIEDFVDLLDWQFQRDDERWGKWQVEIDIKDSDITKEGDQEKQIKLPNLAESVAEFQVNY
jgi:hypothetical protein